MKIVWAPVAMKRIEEFVDFISTDSVTNAAKVAQQIIKSIERLRKFPNSGRIVPELQRKDVREIIKSGFRIIYRIDPKAIAVLTIHHSRQNLHQTGIVYARDLFIPNDSVTGLRMRG